MAGTALLGRLSWLTATVAGVHDETQTARTLALYVPSWPGHAAGQHVDIRLTAEDGYSAVRSYSIANAPSAERVEVTVEEIPDGEVSPYLRRVIAVNDSVEIRGPIGGWFVWRSNQTEPVQLVAGGSGIVPLVAMLRARASSANRAPFRLLYSVRAPESILYADELAQRASNDDGLEITFAFTRTVPPGSSLRPQRIGAELLDRVTFSPKLAPTCYVCGPTGFVEAAAEFLRMAGHDESRIKTERFGPSGGGS
jgi:ferredoxin-NADP reductase